MILNPLIMLLFAVAFVVFFYGVLEFIMNAENDEKRTTGKSHMIWGTIGMFIMASVFGIMTILMDSFGIKNIDVEKGTVELKDFEPPKSTN